MSKSTFNATQIAGFSGYEASTKHMNQWFRTGTQGPTNGTTSLSSFHAYKSMAWFDASAITSALVGERVLSVSFGATSYGASQESDGSRAVRLYRTDLLLDKTKTGWTNADTMYIYDGMTYENPHNSHFIEYAETDPVLKGGSISQSVFAEGELAERFVSALKSGYAIGTFNLKSGSTMAESDKYEVRFLKDISITIQHELENTDVTAPTKAVITNQHVAVGSSASVSFSGATQHVSGTNPITGYNVQTRYKAVGGSWGAWGTAKFYSYPHTEGTLTIPNTGTAGQSMGIRIATVSANNTSDYYVATGECTVVSKPSIGYVDAVQKYQRVDLAVEVPSSIYGGNLFVYVGNDCVGMISTDGGTVSSYVMLDEGHHDLSVTVHDEYGGVSDAVSIHCMAKKRNVGENWCEFKGKRTDSCGLIVTQFLAPSGSDQSVENESVIGRYGDIQSRTDDDVYNPIDMTFELYADETSDANAIRDMFSGDGEIVFGNDPDTVYDISIQKAVMFERFSRGVPAHIVTVTCHVQPFRRSKSDKVLPISTSGAMVYNNGTVSSFPVVTLYGNGNLSFKIGSDEITAQGVSSSVVIDCYHKTAIEGGTMLPTSGTFPRLPVGLNAVYLSDNVSSATIKRRILFR